MYVCMHAFIYVQWAGSWYKHNRSLKKIFFTSLSLFSVVDLSQTFSWKVGLVCLFVFSQIVNIIPCLPSLIFLYPTASSFRIELCFIIYLATFHRHAWWRLVACEGLISSKPALKCDVTVLTLYAAEMVRNLSRASTTCLWVQCCCTGYHPTALPGRGGWLAGW